jgi:hypothetical protein
VVLGSLDVGSKALLLGINDNWLHYVLDLRESKRLCYYSVQLHLYVVLCVSCDLCCWVGMALSGERRLVLWDNLTVC